MRNAHKLNRRIMAVAVGTAMALLAPAAHAAYAGPATAPVKVTSGNGSPFDAQTLTLMAAQQPLTAARQRIEAAQGSVDQGLAGLAIDVPHNAITVHWHGNIPAAVVAEIDRARSRGIAVTVLPSAYSRAQFETEMNRLVARSTAEANRQHTTPLIASVRIRDDFSGIDIGVAGSPTAVASAFAARAGGGDLSSSMPVSTHHEELAVPMATRQADAPPFKGGAAMVSATTGGGCSTGWAVHDSSSRKYILTAAHCGWDNWDTYTKVFSLGRTSNITYSYDAQIIPTGSTNVIYIGSSIADAGGVNQSTRQVVGVLPIGQGTQLCADGAYSGLQCSSITVTSSGPLVTSVFDADKQWRNASLWEAKSGTSNTIAGQGDSGGPVFGVTGSGGSLILAGGTIATGMGSGSSNCNGVPAGGGRLCYTTIRFAAASDELRTLGVTLP